MAGAVGAGAPAWARASATSTFKPLGHAAEIAAGRAGWRPHRSTATRPTIARSCADPEPAGRRADRRGPAMPMPAYARPKPFLPSPQTNRAATHPGRIPLPRATVRPDTANLNPTARARARAAPRSRMPRIDHASCSPARAALLASHRFACASRSRPARRAPPRTPPSCRRSPSARRARSSAARRSAAAGGRRHATGTHRAARRT